MKQFTNGLHAVVAGIRGALKCFVCGGFGAVPCFEAFGVRNVAFLMGGLLLLSSSSFASGAGFARNFGGQIRANVQILATAVDISGNEFIAGNFDSNAQAFGAVTLSKLGNQDAFVAKLDASGTVLWAKNFGGSGATASGQGLAADSSGNVYLGGFFQNADLTTPSLTKIGTIDAFAIKLDTTGTITWAKNFGGNGATASGQGLAADSSGNVYLGGYFQNGNLTTPALARIGNGDAFAIKLDATGTTSWAKNFGGSGAFAIGYGLAADSSGNVYLGGYFESANLTSPSLTRIGHFDAFAIKLDATGTITWAKNFGGSGASAIGQGLAADSSGNVYLGGYFQNANLTTPSLTMIGNVDAFAIKLDATGTTTWAKYFGGSSPLFSLHLII